MTRENRRNGLTAREATPGSNSTFTRRRKPSKRSADPVSPEVYAAVRRRADGRCEVGAAVCSGRPVWHHRLPVAHGGPSTVENGCWACEFHHGWIHHHPWAARVRGLLLKCGDDPAGIPMEVRGDEMVLLTADGRYKPLP